MSNIIRSNEVIENLSLAHDYSSAYPMAFGYAWATLTEKQRAVIIEWSQKEVRQSLKEKKGI